MEQHGVVKFDFVKSEVKRQKDRGEIPHVPLSDEILTQELEKVADRLHGMYFLKTEFLSDKSHVRFRDYVVARFAAIDSDVNPKTLNRQDVIFQSTSVTGREMTPGAFKKVIQEFAYPSGKNLYALKPGDGTIPTSSGNAPAATPPASAASSPPPTHAPASSAPAAPPKKAAAPATAKSAARPAKRTASAGAASAPAPVAPAPAAPPASSSAADQMDVVDVDLDD
jgi:hypothetical protein